MGVLIMKRGVRCTASHGYVGGSLVLFGLRLAMVYIYGSGPGILFFGLGLP